MRFTHGAVREDRRGALCKWKVGVEVPRSIIYRCLELALRAPSCFNTQPYKLIVESKKDKERLANAMREGQGLEAVACFQTWTPRLSCTSW